MLARRRDTEAAYRFLRKALRAVSDHPPSSITTDRLASYPKAIRRLQNEGLLPQDVEHRTSKYLNNIIEADHGALKRVIRPTRGFQTMKTAVVTLMGFETMPMIRHGHCIQRQARPVSSTGSSGTLLEDSFWAGSLCAFQVLGADLPGMGGASDKKTTSLCVMADCGPCARTPASRHPACGSALRWPA